MIAKTKLIALLPALHQAKRIQNLYFVICIKRNYLMRLEVLFPKQSMIVILTILFLYSNFLYKIKSKKFFFRLNFISSFSLVQKNKRKEDTFMLCTSSDYICVHITFCNKHCFKVYRHLNSNRVIESKLRKNVETRKWCLHWKCDQNRNIVVVSASRIPTRFLSNVIPLKSCQKLVHIHTHMMLKIRRFMSIAQCHCNRECCQHWNWNNKMP